MNIVQLPLSKLRAHPANANTMSRPVLAKLRRHIQEQGRYEPLIVREHRRQKGCYEILNGHHRKEVLEQLQYTHADCVVWQVSDEQALMLLATLNRLTGRDDPQRRSELLEKLSRCWTDQELLQKIPETRAQLDKLLALTRPPDPIAPENLAEMPQALIFFVSADQRKIIEEALGKIKKQLQDSTAGRRINRGELLAAMARRIVGKSARRTPGKIK